MSTIINGTYINGVRIDDLRGSVEFTHLKGKTRVTLTYAQLTALRLELEALNEALLAESASAKRASASN